MHSRKNRLKYLRSTGKETVQSKHCDLNVLYTLVCVRNVTFLTVTAIVNIFIAVKNPIRICARKKI